MMMHAKKFSIRSLSKEREHISSHVQINARQTKYMKYEGNKSILAGILTQIEKNNRHMRHA